MASLEWTTLYINTLHLIINRSQYSESKKIENRSRSKRLKYFIARARKGLSIIFNRSIINQLSVFDDYIRHGDMAEFCVTTAISVMRETLLQFDI